MSIDTDRPQEQEPDQDARRSPLARMVSRVPSALWSLLLAVAVIVVVQWLTSSGVVSRLVLPTPTSIWRALKDGFGSGIYGPNLVSTLVATVVGFVIAALIALILAGILASSGALERVLLPFVVALQTMPKIAIAPLFILWIGFGLDGKVSIVVVVCFFPILINCLQGLKIRDQDTYDLFRSLGASRWHTLRYLRIPMGVPYFFAGFHIGIIFALIGSVTAEFVGSRNGLGYVLLLNKANFNVPGVFSLLFVLMVLGLLLDFAMRFAENWVAKKMGTKVVGQQVG